MDRDFVEKVIKLVTEVLEERGDIDATSSRKSVKIWPHKSPPPDYIKLAHAKSRHTEAVKKPVRIKPYLPD